jgi:hypothetical protein
LEDEKYFGFTKQEMKLKNGKLTSKQKQQALLKKKEEELKKCVGCDGDDLEDGPKNTLEDKGKASKKLPNGAPRTFKRSQSLPEKLNTLTDNAIKLKKSKSVPLIHGEDLSSLSLVDVGENGIRQEHNNRYVRKWILRQAFMDAVNALPVLSGKLLGS